MWNSCVPNGPIDQLQLANMGHTIFCLSFYGCNRRLKTWQVCLFSLYAKRNYCNRLPSNKHMGPINACCVRRALCCRDRRASMGTDAGRLVFCRDAWSVATESDACTRIFSCICTCVCMRRFRLLSMSNRKVTVFKINISQLQLTKQWNRILCCNYDLCLLSFQPSVDENWENDVVDQSLKINSLQLRRTKRYHVGFLLVMYDL